jgi:hypothetical protein
MFLLICQFNSFLPYTKVHAQIQNNRMGEESKQNTTSNEARKTFKKGRELLLDYGLPFEPNELLEANNKDKVLHKLELLPEFKNSEQGGKRIKGVKIADTLYLPENVKLEGDTVIIVRFLIFEGKDVLIRGNYDLHVFPLETVGVLGTTLTEAITKQKPRFVNAKYSKLANRSFSSLALPLIKDSLITVDLHGYGRKDWLEQKKKREQNDKRQSQIKFQTASYWTREASALTQVDNHGNPGSEGIWPGVAGSGTNGAHGAPGTSGSCAGNKEGGPGGIGIGGGPGNEGDIGGRGGDGTPGGSVTWNVRWSNLTGHETLCKMR